MGKRGRTLLFFAFLDLVYALSLANPNAGTRSSPQLTWLSSLAPLWVWALLWAMAGGLCAWYAFRRRDRWGFVAAIAIKVLWGVASLGGWLFAGVDRGYVSAAIWLVFAAFVGNTAGWAEPGDQKGPTWIPPSS